MNGAHWHLLVNHFPVVLQLVGVPVAIYGTARRQPPLQQLGLGIIVLAAVFTVISYLTGDGAADVLKNVPGIVDANIDTHALAAEWALRAAVLVGLLSAVLLARCVMGRTTAKGWWIAHGVIAVWGLSVIAVTSHHGGVIRHPEIQQQSAKP